MHRHHAPRSILLVRLDHVGDCVLTLPAAVRRLKAAHPERTVDVLTTGEAAGLLRDDALIDRLIAFDAPWSIPGPRFTYLARMSGGLRRMWGGQWASYDVVAYLSFSPWERWMTRRFAPVRVGFDGPYQRRAFVWSCRWLTTTVPFDTGRHLLDNTGSLLERIGELGPPEESRLSIPTGSAPAAIEDLNRNSRIRWLVGVHPGRADSFKSWPAERFAELARVLCERLHAGCLVITAPDQAELGRRVEQLSGHPDVRAVTTATMREFALTAQHLDLVVANDGGPMHVSACLGTPTVAIFGPTDDTIYGPRGAHTRTVRADHPEAPCAWPWDRHTPCCEGRQCLSEVSVEDAYASAHELISMRGSGGRDK